MARLQRVDGVQAREWTLPAALRPLVDRGGTRASVRDRAHAADAAIGGDVGVQAGLRRSAPHDPPCGQPVAGDDFARRHWT